MAVEDMNEEDIFRNAIEFEDRDEQADYVKKACGDDMELRTALEALLRHHHECSILDAPALESSLIQKTTPITEGPGMVIGRYKLLEQIGEGGMAVVYMAEQQEPIRRKVALKIIKLGMDTKSVIARFEAERQALAMMDHPNIAKVFDAGATETGRPYFVMELVKGTSITEYCDLNKLSTRQRLQLFTQVCNAVQHAHQKGIIHRDIKPSNVMITLHDGVSVPKVIDFGIAKATNSQLTEKTVFTRYAQMIGTPAYMSPEQAEMSGLDVDTRTDIYSLGVLLYELLTGTTPFDAKMLLEAGYAEMQRIIQETDPLKPSTKIRTLGQTLTDVAQSRQASPEILGKLFRGDLDWIVMKTLEKNRTHRYETAHALVEDIERHLRHEPITAVSPGLIYCVQKFLRRHRVRVITWSAAAVIVVGLFLVAYSYVRFTIQRTRTDHQRSLALVEDLLSSGEYRQALRKIKPILSSRFVGPKARLLHARILLELQDPEAGIEQLRNLLGERPEIAANAHFLLAAIYLEAAPNDHMTKNKVEIHLRQGERLLPKTADAYLLRAITAQTVQETVNWLEEALELDPTHFGARRASALAYYALGEYRNMETEASIMIGSQPKNPAGYSLRAIARREIAITQNDSDLLNQAIADHDRAASLIAPRDRRLVELSNQRRKTLMRMGKYDRAIADAKLCLKLQPQEEIYKFHLFCALVALGDYEKAQTEYDKILELDRMKQSLFNCSAAKYVFDSLCTGQSWYPQDKRPTGTAFEAMHRATEEYRQLAGIARRVVAEGFHTSWSPDGTHLAYSRGVLGASGIEILNLETSKTRLLTVPGKDPSWSPDGKYIVYVRTRQIMSLKDLTSEPQGKHSAWEQDEVWIARADGTDHPRFLARGGWPNWSGDSNRIYYHCRLDNKVYSVRPNPNNPESQEIFTCGYKLPVISPDEKYIAFMTDEMTFQIVDLADRSVVAHGSWPKEEGQYLFLTWSPDGRQLSVGLYRGGGLWIYDVTHKKATKIVEGSFSRCSWSSPDMRRIAIEKVYGQWHHEIWIADNSVQKKLETQKQP